MFDSIVCHYGEIGLKGKNRSFFELKLAGNIAAALKRKKVPFREIKRLEGRVVVFFARPAAKDILERAIPALKKVPGLVYFAPAVFSSNEIKEITQRVLKLVEKKPGQIKSFRITAVRSDKNYPLSSPELNETIGAAVVDKFGLAVKLKDSDLNIVVEVIKDSAFIYDEKIKGLGGLPVASSGRALVLISGGIDSPVAAFFALKRGLAVDFIHFHSHPFTDQSSIERVKMLIDRLMDFQSCSRLFLVPFIEVQQALVKIAPERLRVVLYRRAMVKIANEIAKQSRCLALVTGESLGQVASQTLANINTVNQASDLVILRPLVGLDKQEIIDYAREINTYDISNLPCSDTCNLFAPRYPATKSELSEVKPVELNSTVKKAIKKALSQTEVIKFQYD